MTGVLELVSCCWTYFNIKQDCGSIAAAGFHRMHMARWLVNLVNSPNCTRSEVLRIPDVACGKDTRHSLCGRLNQPTTGRGEEVGWRRLARPRARAGGTRWGTRTADHAASVIICEGIHGGRRILLRMRAGWIAWGVGQDTHAVEALDSSSVHGADLMLTRRRRKPQSGADMRQPVLGIRSCLVHLLWIKETRANSS